MSFSNKNVRFCLIISSTGKGSSNASRVYNILEIITNIAINSPKTDWADVIMV